MKKVIIFSLLLSSFVAIFNSCRKEDNVKLPDLTRAPLPLVTKDPSADDVISGSDPAAFAGSFPYTDKSSLITPLSLSSPFYPSRPYIFGTLEWEFAAGFTPDMSKQYYCLLPAMDPDGIHVTYTYITIPYSFQYKDSSVSIPDTSFVKNLGQEELDSLTVSALAATISGSTKINPCPPKTP